MDMNDLAKQVTESEGLKQSVSIAQVKEVLGIVADAIVNEPKALVALLQNGIHRSSGK